MKVGLPSQDHAVVGGSVAMGGSVATPRANVSYYYRTKKVETLRTEGDSKHVVVCPVGVAD